MAFTATRFQVVATMHTGTSMLQLWISGPVVVCWTCNWEGASLTLTHPLQAILGKLISYCVLCSGQHSILPSVGWEMSS